MADARQVLEVAVDEAALLVNSSHDEERTGEWYEVNIRPLVELARDALYARDGQVADDAVRASGIHPAKLARLGL